MSYKFVMNSVDVKPQINGSSSSTGNSSIPKLITQLRSAFRPAEFDGVQKILMEREENLTRSSKEMNMRLEKLSKKYDELEKKHCELAYKKLEMEDKAKKYKKLFEELREKPTPSNEDLRVWSDRLDKAEKMFLNLSHDLDKEKSEKMALIVELNEKVVELNREKTEKNKAEFEAGMWKKKYEELVPRIEKLEEGIGLMLKSDQSLNTRIEEEEETGSRKLDSGNESKRKAAVADGFGELVQPQMKQRFSKLDVKADKGATGAGSTSNPPVPRVNGLKEEGTVRKKMMFESGASQKKMGSSIAVIDIDDSDDEKPAGDGTVVASYIAEDNGFSCMTNSLLSSTPKRKRDLTCNMSNVNSDGDGITRTGKGIMRNIDVLIHESKPNLGGKEDNAEATRPSSQAYVRPLEEQHEHGSLKTPSISESDDSSDENDSDFMDNLVANLRRARGSKEWAYAADMLNAFKIDNELCMNAVCALYRQQKSVKDPLSTNKRGFNHCVMRRGSALAEFLIDGDPEGKLRKSVSELQQYDRHALGECRKLANLHYKQLFEIYQKEEDPFFRPSNMNSDK